MPNTGVQIAIVESAEDRAAFERLSAAWTAYRRATEKHGLEFGKVCCEWRDEHKAQGSHRGLGFEQVCTKLQIPRRTAYWWIKQYEISTGRKADALAEAIAEIEVPTEVAEAVEYIPPPASAKSGAKNKNSQTVLLRQLFEKMKSVKLVRLAPSTFNSGVPSASGRYDLELNGLTPAQVKKIRELL
jgi:hypothetical protein